MYTRYIMRAMQIRAMTGLVVYVNVQGDKSRNLFMEGLFLEVLPE